MDWFLEFLKAYKMVIYPSLLALIFIIILIKFWEEIKFWWMCTWMGFPLIGRIARLSKDIDSQDDQGWFHSETTICSDFDRYYDKYNKDSSIYENSKSYLQKAEELGRRNFPFIMWVIVFLLVIAEALGFSYVLAGYTIPGASESLQEKGAIGIAFVISIILVGFTHWTGHEIYKNGLVKKIRISYNNDINDNKPKLEQQDQVTLENNNRDDNEPRYIKLINRIPTNAYVKQNWMITTITALLVIFIAIGATYVRGQVLEKQLNQEVQNIETNVYEVFPSDLVKSQKKADNKALEEQQDSDRKGGWATFIVLAILFVFIQILGIIFGWKWGFVGKESKEAYYYIKGFATKQEFENYFKRRKEQIVKIANQKLKELQQKMSQRVSKISTSNETNRKIKNRENRNFLTFTQMQKIEEQAVSSEVQHRDYSTNTQALDFEKIHCHNCKAQLEKGANFCLNCGAKVGHTTQVPTCPNCGKTYGQGIKFCQDDGKELELR